MTGNKIYSCLCVLLLLLSCNKRDSLPVAPTDTVTQKEVNDWILENMRNYYLNNHSLPANAAKSEEAVAYFKSLLSTQDRFSAIYDSRDHGTIPRGMLRSLGIDYYVIAWPAAPYGVIGVINFVIPGTRADIIGLKRGVYFTRINGKQLTATNAEELSKELLQRPSGNITLVSLSANQQPVETGSVTLEVRTIVENPLYVQTVWDVNNKKTGYVFLNSFDDFYNADLLKCFEKFKNEGVSELILDLRYNPGGSITAATVLCVLVAPGIDENKSFIQFSGNNNLKTKMHSFKDMLAVPGENNAVISFNDLQFKRLQLPRVFVLSTGITASAAEVVINNLKPYMQVIHIGETTHGKDVGSISITDNREPQRIPWVLLPETYKLANAKGEGGYAQGIVPQYQVDETAQLPLLPVGSKEDPLVTKALSIISGQTVMPGRLYIRKPDVLFHSMQNKVATSTLVISLDK
jgi:carboxyl-terminal processing protease